MEQVLISRANAHHLLRHATHKPDRGWVCRKSDKEIVMHRQDHVIWESIGGEAPQFSSVVYPVCAPCMTTVHVPKEGVPVRQVDMVLLSEVQP